jgi:rhamnulokinase
MQINSLYQLYSIKLHNESLLAKCDKILFMPDLINYLLTGEIKSEYTIASTSQLLNASTKAFDKKIFSALDIPMEITSPIVNPGTVIGKLLPEISKETGLGKVDVIAVGCHDTASAVAAVPALGNDWAYLSSGTWSLLGIETDEPIINDSLKTEFTNEGGVNGKIRFLKNIAGMWLLQEVKKCWEEKGDYLDYNEINNMALNAKEFLCYIEPDGSSFINPFNMVEAINNYCIKTSQKAPSSKGEYVRSIIESLALKYKTVVDQIERISGRRINSIHVVGGGSQNELLNQFTANATGKNVFAGPVEATALGNILVQAIAKGKVKSLDKARNIVAESFKQKLYTPKVYDSRWNSIPV